MWRNHKHKLNTLAKLCSIKVKFQWTRIEQKSFIEMKKVGRDLFLLYPNFSEEFIIHTDARKMQLEGVISKNGNPIAL